MPIFEITAFMRAQPYGFFTNCDGVMYLKIPHHIGDCYMQVRRDEAVARKSEKP